MKAKEDDLHPFQLLEILVSCLVMASSELSFKDTLQERDLKDGAGHSIDLARIDHEFEQVLKVSVQIAPRKGGLAFELA